MRDFMVYWTGFGSVNIHKIPALIILHEFASIFKEERFEEDNDLIRATVLCLDLEELAALESVKPAGNA